MTTTIQSTPVQKSVLSGPDGGDWARAFFPYWLDGVMAVGWYPVELAQTSNLAGTYTGATGGAPGYLTVTATGALSVDSVAVAVGDRILLQNQSTGAERGVFDVTVAGGSGVHPVLTRSQDASASGDFQQGKVVSVVKGTSNVGKTFICTFTPPFVLDTGTPSFTATAASVTFSSVNSALAAANAPIDVNGQALTGLGNLTMTKEVAATVKIADTSTAATVGAALTVAAGKGKTSGTGGALALKGGAGDTASAGGAASLTGGAGGSASGAGGAASLAGGLGTAGIGGAASVAGGAAGAATFAGGAVAVTGGAGLTTGAGGAASMTAGAGGNDAVGGAASITAGAAGGGNRAGGAASLVAGAGAGTQAGGAIAVTAGAGGATGAGGAVAITAGAGGASSGTGGAVVVAGGAGSGGNANGGALTLRGGAKNGSGAHGAIVVGDSNTTALQLGVGNLIADPGTAAPIPVTYSGTCALTVGSAGAETNTVAAPSFVGQLLTICGDVVGSGTRVITLTGNTTVLDGTNNTITISAAGQSLTMQGIQVGGAKKWSLVVNRGTALSFV